MEIGVVTAHSGRHFLQIPEPTNVPDRVLHAIAQPTIDHRGPDFAELTQDLLQRVRPVFGTSGPVVVYPSSGTGAWEAALVNTLSPGDRVLAFETGHFATLWRDMAERHGRLAPRRLPLDSAGRARRRPRNRRGDGGSQRDLDGRDEPDPRDPSSDGA